MIFKSLIALVFPALMAKTIEIEQHPDHVFKIESVKYSGQDKTGWLLFNDILIKSNDLAETHSVKDDYFELHANKSMKINQEWLFYKTQDCSISLNLYEWKTEEYKTPQIDCNNQKHGHLEMKFGDHTYKVKYSVKEMPKFEKYFQLMYLWDLSTPVVKEGDDLYIRQQISYHNNTYVWRVPRNDYFEFDRAGFVVFKNLYLPCIKDHDVEIQLVREGVFGDSYSELEKINCQSNDFYQGLDFHVSYSNYGQYRIIGKMVSGG